MTIDKVDIGVSQGNGIWDISFEEGDIKPTCGLDTAVYLSLLTDSRATDSQVYDPKLRRGWLGNVATPVVGRDLGGKLWLLEQSRLDQDALNNAVDYANKSLSWLVEDNVCVKILVSGKIVPRSGIELDVQITSSDGVTSNIYVQLWHNTINGCPPVAEEVLKSLDSSWILATGYWNDGYWDDNALWID